MAIGPTAPHLRQSIAAPLVLYLSCFRDPVSGAWLRARYKAERQVIAARDAEWELPCRTA